MLSGKQNEYIRNANARWNLKIGAVRSGKTYVDIVHIIPARLREAHGKGGLSVILGVSRETIERNVLRPMREKYTSAIVGSINSRNIAKICGEDVYCIGAEKRDQVSKIQGMSIKYCYGDEIAKWSPEVFSMLQSRLDKSYSRFDGSCNPESPNHWLKDFIDKPNIDIYIQKYTIFDNPFLPKEFVEKLCYEYAGQVYYKRYILGEWALAEGLIYPMYEKAFVDSPPDVEPSEYCVSIDYGTMNAFAGILWVKRSGIWYAERQYYHSGRDSGIQKTDQEYAEELEKWVDDVWRTVNLGGMRKIETIIDPSAASFIAVLQKSKWSKVRQADNSVADGIRNTAVAMQTGKIKIVRNSMKNWEEEAGGYIWDNTVDEKPVKVDDHLMDATRYFVQTKHISRPGR